VNLKCVCGKRKVGGRGGGGSGDVFLKAGKQGA